MKSLITVIMPDNKLANIKRVGELERTVSYYQQARQKYMKERAKWLELFEDWVHMAGLPSDHTVSKILKAEYSEDV